MTEISRTNLIHFNWLQRCRVKTNFMAIIRIAVGVARGFLQNEYIRSFSRRCAG